MNLKDLKDRNESFPKYVLYSQKYIIITSFTLKVKFLKVSYRYKLRKGVFLFIFM